LHPPRIHSSGIPSWRTAKGIFATLPDAEHLHVMLDEGGIRAAVAELLEDAWRVHS
jgi:hypothetical protein